MLFIFSPCSNAHGNGVLKQNLTQNGKKVHRTLWALWIDVHASSNSHFFLGLGIWLPSNKNIAPVLFNYHWFSAEWCNSPSKSYFFSLFVYTLCVFHSVSLGLYTPNKCHFSIVSSTSFLSASIQAFNTFSLPLFSCLFFPRAGGFYFTPLSS